MKSALGGFMWRAVVLGCLGWLAGCQTTETPRSQFGRTEPQEPTSALGRVNRALDKADDKIQDVLWGPEQ